MAQVFEINKKKQFDLVSANDILPIIKRVTHSSYQKIQRWTVQHSFVKDAYQKKTLEAKMDKELKDWQCKITKLGGHPKGMWLVDFDNGEGYFCWRFPENDISHYHGYLDGFQGRTPLTQ